MTGLGGDGRGRAYRGVRGGGRIQFDGMRYRSDIAEAAARGASASLCRPPRSGEHGTGAWGHPAPPPAVERIGEVDTCGARTRAESSAEWDGWGGN